MCDSVLEYIKHAVFVSFLGGDTERTQSDLLQQLRQNAELSEKGQGGSGKSMTSLLSGFQLERDMRFRRGGPEKVRRPLGGDTGDNRRARQSVDRFQSSKKARDSKDPTSYERKREVVGKEPRERDMALVKMKLYDGPSLGIFQKQSFDKTQRKQRPQTLYEKLQEQETSALLEMPPRNALEEEIRWTEQGKLWSFPINNEAGMEKEATVGFQEHIFLERFLTDFPKQGPVRHFMELVTVGLSKNPFLTVEQKQEHIEWFKEYFSDKYGLIDELTEVAGKSQ